jgi:ABC-type transport system substrate-binding protein
VKFSLERLFNPANKSGGASLYSGLPIVGNKALQDQKSATLPGIKVVDNYTFTIEMERPDSVVLYVLALPFASIVPRDVVTQLGAKKFASAPIGSGPFKMTSVNFARGQVLDRNEKYWKPGIPYVDRVNWRTGVDPQLSILRIESGQQDMIVDQVPAGSLAAIRNSQYSSQLVTGLYRNTYFLGLPAGQDADFKDLRVRQAIASAIDKQRIVQVVGGLGLPADGGLFNPLTPFYLKGVAYPYNPATAKSLMAAAAPKGFSVTLEYGNYPPFPDIVAVIQDNLKQIGITVNPKDYTQVSPGIHPDMNVSSWSQPYPHGSYLLDATFTQKALTAGCCNVSDWVDPKLQALLDAGHAASDPHKIATIYKAADKYIVKDQALWVPLFYPKLASLVSTRTHGFAIPPGPIINVKFFSRYWVS